MIATCVDWDYSWALFCLYDPRSIRSANLKERNLATKRCLILFTLCALFSTVMKAQEANQEPKQDAAQKTAIISEFTRSAKMDGVILSFVLLNNKTVDALFSGDGKYAMRARANMSTLFFVQGVPEKNITLDPKFVVEQDGKTFTGETINMRNLQAGAVAKGTRIEGLIQLSQKINVTQPFKIRCIDNASADFKLSRQAIKLLEN